MKHEDTLLEPDPVDDGFEALLRKRERDRRRVVVTLAILLACGAVLLATPLLLGAVKGGLRLLAAVGATGLACAALVLALGPRLSSADARASDWMGQVMPRFLGGRTPEQLDRHRRRRRRSR